MLAALVADPVLRLVVFDRFFRVTFLVSLASQNCFSDQEVLFLADSVH